MNKNLLSQFLLVLYTKEVEIKRYSFSRAGVKLWNELPTKLRVLPKSLFKQKIKIVLFNNLESEDLYDDFEALVTKVKS